MTPGFLSSPDLASAAEAMAARPGDAAAEFEALGGRFLVGLHLRRDLVGEFWEGQARDGRANP